jgi:hypothetical protein
MKSIMRLSTVGSVLALAGALAFSGQAAADTVTANYSNVSPGTNVGYRLTGNTGAFTTTTAGVFNFTATDAGPILTYETNKFVSFCIDLDDTIKANPQVWDVVSLANAPNPSSSRSMGPDKAGDLAKLLGGVLGTSLNNARNTASYNLGGSGLTLDAAQRAAALQIAIWEIVWEDSNNAYGVADGQLQFNLGANNVIRQQANYWLANLSDYMMGGLVGLTSPTEIGGIKTQDFIGQVPIPAAAWLFGSALIGVAALGRRNRKETKDSETFA